MRPVNRGPIPTDKNAKPKRYREYQHARKDLIERLGEYCSYCEMELDASLAVEHIQAKEHHPDLALEWRNFLLACTNCNSTKGQKNHLMDDVLWPHLDNTFRAFEYGDEGIVKPSPWLSQTLKARAMTSIALTGLARSTDQQTASERRWLNRREAWHIARESKQDLAECDCEAMRRQIVRSARAKGFWSIWMTVFADDSDMLTRLIKAFPGTAEDCFDTTGQAIPRPGGQL